MRAAFGLADPAELLRRTVRIGVTGLSRAGKTSFMTSLATNLRAMGRGAPSLPALAQRLGGQPIRVTTSPSEASDLPRFDDAAHLASLVADPPAWPDRTDAVSLLSLDIEIPGARFGFGRRLRLELLDYPGEWLLDLPLLAQDFRDWSAQTLRRLAADPARPFAEEFLRFSAALPAKAGADEALVANGHRLFAALLVQLRDQAGLAFLQPGRFLRPPPGPPAPWLAFFPHTGSGGLADLMARRYDAYRDAVRRDLLAPMFGHLDRVIILADILSALHAGPAAFDDAADALLAASRALRWQRSWWDILLPLTTLRLPPPRIRRVAYAATKVDHVGERQRANVAELMAQIAPAPEDVAAAHLAIASVRCTEDFVWTLDDRPVSAVRGRVVGDPRMTRSYPGEVPSTRPDAAFWAHRFLALPLFEPIRPPLDGRGGIPHINLDRLLVFMLDDVL